MKKQSAVFYLAMALIMIVVFKTACKNKATPPGYSSKAPTKRTIFDTTRVIGVFVTPNRDNIVHDITFKVRYDSVETLVDAGGGTFKKLWHTDSAYFLPKLITLLDTVTKKPLRDAQGNERFTTQWVGPYTKDLVWDSNINVDSAQKKFKGFLLPDSVTKK